MKISFLSVAAIAAMASIGTVQTAAAQDCMAGSPEDNVMLVKNYVEAVTANDGAKVAEMLHEGLSHNLSRGDADYGNPSMSDIAARAPDDVKIEDIFGSGDKVAVRYSFTVKGDAVEGAAADSSAKVNAIAIAQVDCGKIKQVWIEQDDLGLAIDMGMSLQSSM